MNQIDEGRIMLDVSEIWKSDIFPYLSEKEAELNETRARDGKLQFEVDYDSVEVIEDTLYADCHLLCKMCNHDLNMTDDEQLEAGLCEVCVTFETPKLLAQMAREL